MSSATPTNRWRPGWARAGRRSPTPSGSSAARRRPAGCWPTAQISAGHARALLGTPDRGFQEELAKRAWPRADRPGRRGHLCMRLWIIAEPLVAVGLSWGRLECSRSVPGDVVPIRCQGGRRLHGRSGVPVPTTTAGRADLTDHGRHARLAEQGEGHPPAPPVEGRATRGTRFLESSASRRPPGRRVPVAGVIGGRAAVRAPRSSRRSPT
jgi:hypothetical protein